MDNAAEDSTSLRSISTSRSRLVLLAIATCYAWLAVLFAVWLQDGLNVLIQREFANLLKLATLLGTLVVAITYFRLQFARSAYRTVAYICVLAVLQIAATLAISNHTVDRFPF